MRKTTLIILALLLITMGPQPSSAAKIQKDDTWQYTDSLNNTHNETALGIVQLQSGDDIMAAAVVNTTRPLVHNYQGAKWLNGSYTNMSINYDLDMTPGPIYVTQQGGIPIYPDRQFSGNVSIWANTNFSIINDTLGYKTINISSVLDSSRWEYDNSRWSFSGDPATALTTTTSIEYSVTSFSTFYNDTDKSYIRYDYKASFIISTDNDLGDTVKDFTFTKTFEQFSFQLSENSVSSISFILTNDMGVITAKVTHIDGIYGVSDYIIVLNPLSLSQTEDEAMLITIDEAYNVPTYIRQTEPVDIKRGLALSQLQLVEYFLVIDNNAKGDGFVPILPWFSTVIFLLLISNLVRKRG